MKLELIRTYYPNGTNGQILLNGDKVCPAIELPWKNNASQISCIPEGEYELRKRWSQKFGWHFELMNVPCREYILIHPANDAVKELKGASSVIRRRRMPPSPQWRRKKAGFAVLSSTGFIFNRGRQRHSITNGFAKTERKIVPGFGKERKSFFNHSKRSS